MEVEQQEGMQEKSPETLLWQYCKEHPWEFDSWNALVLTLERNGDNHKIREGYEDLLKEFPLMFGYW
jgi:hypothetical protein